MNKIINDKIIQIGCTYLINFKVILTIFKHFTFYL